MPPSPSPLTIGDAIAAKVAAEAAERQAKDAASEADAEYARTQDANIRAGVDLKADLASVGPAFVEDPDGGGIVVYVPDASSIGYHVIRPVAGGTPLGGGPEPTPEPPPEPPPSPFPPPVAE